VRNPTLIRIVVAVTALALIVSVAIYVWPGRGPASTPAFSETDVLAVVNGEAVTKGQVYEYMWSQVGPQSVEELITRRLVQQEAGRRGVSVSEDQVDARVAELAEQYGGRETLELLLNSSGMSLEVLRENLRLNLLIEALLAPEIDISEEDLHAYYDENPQQFVEPEQVQARHILVEDRETAEDLIRQLEEGADFADLAREHSTDTVSAENGGDLGWFTRGRMVEPFEEAAFGAEPGAVVGPVETQFGFHVIEVLDKKAERTIPFEEAREQIRETLFQQEIQARVGSWLQSLRDQADIETRY